MKNRWLYLPIEIANRELNSKLLIALEAKKRGYKILFGAGHDLLRLLLCSKPGVVIVKDSAGYNYEKFKKLRLNGHKIVVHDEEGFVHINDDIFIDLRLDKNTLTEVDLYCCWGKYQKNIVEKFAKNNGINLNIKSTGHPRIDLLRKELNEEKETNKHMILINTKLTTFNYIEGKSKFLSDLKRLKAVSKKFDTQFWLDHLKYDEIYYNEFLKLIEKLSKNYPNSEIILRPHPSENENSWKKDLSQFSNVHVTKEDSIHNWINKADVVIHSGCTTGIEALIMDKYVISFLPYKDKRFDVPLPNLVSNIANNIDEVINYIDNKNLFLENQINKKKLLEYRIESLNGNFAFRNIMDSIEDLSKNIDYRFNFFKEFEFYFRKSLVKRKFNKKFENITEDKINYYLNKYKNILGYKFEAKAREIANNIFILQ